MPSASLLVRKHEGYPHHAARAGLSACGYDVSPKYPPEGDNSRLLVTWTLWSHSYKAICANKHASLGGRTLCMENEWVKSPLRKYWQLAERVGRTPGINGWGAIPQIDDDGKRWRSFGIQLLPWRKDSDGFILVCPQRGVKDNDPEITHGASWTEEVIKKIRKCSDRPIHWRPHPGAPGKATLPLQKRGISVVDPRLPLSVAVRGAHTVVVYSSTAASTAIISGIPVVYDGPRIMAHELAGGIKDVENPPMADREPVLHKLAYGQWSDDELASGEAFSYYADSASL